MATPYRIFNHPGVYSFHGRARDGSVWLYGPRDHPQREYRAVHPSRVRTLDGKPAFPSLARPKPKRAQPVA